MLQQIHLQNCLIHTHWLNGKALCLDYPVLFRLYSVLILRCKSIDTQPFFQTGLVFDDLSDKGIDNHFQGIKHVTGRFLRPEHHIGCPNGNFHRLSVPLPGYGDHSHCILVKKAIQLFELFLNAGLE